MSGDITIIDVCRALRIEPTPNLTWVVGALVRERYREVHRRYPSKQLREKTNGGGSHCFAVYPVAFRSEIERILLAHQTESARQMDLNL